MKRTYDATTDPALTPDQRRNAVLEKANAEAIAYAEEQKVKKAEDRAEARAKRLKAEGRIDTDGRTVVRNPQVVRTVK